MSRAGIAAAASAALALGLFVAPGPDALPAARATVVVRTGWQAILLLLATLAVSPLGRRAPRLRPWRRALGLAAAVAAAAHVAAVARAGWLEPLEGLLTEPQLRAGGAAALILVALTLTSSRRLVRALRLGHWRPLHRLVYVAGAFVVHHVALSAHAPPSAPYALGAAWLGLLLARVNLRR